MLGTWSVRKEGFFFSQDVQPDVEDRQLEQQMQQV